MTKALEIKIGDSEFEITAEQVQCIETWLNTQVVQQIDSATQKPMLVRLFENAEEYLFRAVGDVVHAVLQQVPTQEMREQIVAANEAARKMRECASPKRKQKTVTR